MELTNTNSNSNELALIESGDWGAGENVTQEDLVIQKILIMQPQSRSVIKGIAKQGEFRGSLDNVAYSNAEGKMDIVVFAQDKIWTVYETKKDHKGKDVTEWKETFPWTLQNRELAWNEELPNGVQVSRQKAFNFYCLIKNEQYENNIPVIIRMKSTSYNTGKRLSTLFAQWVPKKKKVGNKIVITNPGRSSASHIITLTAHQQENDRGVFYIWDFNVDRETTKEEQAVAYKWFTGWKESQLRVDETEETKKEVEETDEIDFLG